MFYRNEKLMTTRDKLSGYQVPTLEELRVYKPNAVGTQWVPINHLEFVDMIRAVLSERGYSIDSEELMHGASRKAPEGINVHDLYGYFTISGKLPHLEGFRRVLAFRHSNVQNFAAKILSGAQVTLCTNGLANGEYILDRKHTSGLNLRALIGEAVTAWEGQQTQLDGMIADLQAITLTPEQACFILMNAAYVDIFSSDKLVPIYGEYLDPVHEEWRNPTGWCLLQAVTQKAKAWGLARQEEAMHRMPAYILATYAAFNAPQED